ncbi:MAG TPA: hypothetical protein VM509_06790 [Planctomycetota bacterium]|nr:hypothetical protein [Planctomycetota bacterium]
MAEPRVDPSVLARECAAWCRYLADLEGSPKLVARYVDAHAQGVAAPTGPRCAFDDALVALARRGTFLTRLCDVHARIFRPAGLLRRKLVLALALLETDAESHERVDRPTPGSRSGFLVLCALWSLRFVLLFGLGLLVLLPLRAFCALGGGGGDAT